MVVNFNDYKSIYDFCNTLKQEFIPNVVWDVIESITLCNVRSLIYYRFKDNDFISYIKEKLSNLKPLMEIDDIETTNNVIGNYSLIIKVKPEQFNVDSIVEINRIISYFYNRPDQYISL